MDDSTQEILQTALAALVRHGLTVLAGYLLARGLIVDTQQAQFVDIGASIAAGAFGYLWSLYQKQGVAAMKTVLSRIHNDPSTTPQVKALTATVVK